MRTSHRGGQTQTSIASWCADRGKTVTKPLVLNGLGLPSSESRFPKLLKTLTVEENPEKLWKQPQSL
jgi:hypothetical protein